MDSYCLHTFAPNGRNGWLWVEGDQPWGGLYEKGDGNHNGRGFWFRQYKLSDESTSGTRFVCFQGLWWFAETSILTTTVPSPSNVAYRVNLQPPSTSALGGAQPNGYVSSDGRQNVWDYSFFMKYRTVISPTCQQFCSANTACEPSMYTACDGSLNTTGWTTACECFRPQPFYRKLAKAIAEGHGVGYDMVDDRPMCVHSGCRNSAVRLYAGTGCRSVTSCNASATLTQTGGITIGNSTVSASCTFNGDGGVVIEQTEEVENVDPSHLILGSKSGNLLASLEHNYGFNFRNPFVRLVCVMVIAAILVVIVYEID